MHLPQRAPALRGRILLLVSRMVAVPLLRRIILWRLMAETRIRELPESW